MKPVSAVRQYANLNVRFHATPCYLTLIDDDRTRDGQRET